MNVVTTIFNFTCDNEPLALEEISQQIRDLGLDPGEPVVTETSEPDDLPDDWFDDVIFTVRTNVSSDKYSCEEIKELIRNGGFESYEFV